MTAVRYEAVESWIEKAGHYALLVAAGLGLIYGVVGAIKCDQLSFVLMGVAWIPCVGVAQYSAYKFSSTSRGLIKTSSSQLSSGAFLTCLALWNLLLGVISFIGLTYCAIKIDSLSVFMSGIVAFAICELVVWLCLNPSLLNINIVPASTAGEEAVGFLTFAMKALLRLVPIAFGIGIIVGDFLMLSSLIVLFRDEELWMTIGFSSVFFVLGSAALPLIGYVLFVLNYLFLDVIRAILSIPAKVDAIAKD